MRTSSRLLIAAALFSACSSSSKRTLGETCERPDQCASGRCDELVCKASQPLADGEACEHPLQCRSEQCIASRCATVTPDGATPDAEPPDAQAPDAQPTDAGATDAEAPDAGICDATEWTLTITANENDGEIDTDSFLAQGEGPAQGNALMIGYWVAGGDDPTWGYFRYALPAAIPAAAKIQSMELRLWGKNSAEWDPVRHALRVWLEDSADAALVTAASEQPQIAGGRPITTTSLRWPAGGGLDWTLDARNASPNLAPLLQSLVDSYGGLAAGAHIQLWLAADFVAANAEVGTFDWAENPDRSAELTIRWCP